MADVLLWVVVAALVVTGLAGTVLPALPGPILVFAAVLLVAWADGFARIGAPTLILLGVLTVAAHTVDLAGGAMGVRRAGASGRAVVGAALGAAAGLFFGLPGLLLGPLVGAVAAELTVQRDLRAASTAGLAAGIGFVVGTAIKVALVVAMPVIAAVAYLF